MLLVLEIGLTIGAWRRGWKGWALLPIGVGAGLSFISGVIMGASGATDGSVFAIGSMFDLACIGSLLGMVVKPRKLATS